MPLASLRPTVSKAGLVVLYPLRRAAAQQRHADESRRPRPCAFHVLPARRPAHVAPMPGNTAVTQFGDRLPEHAGAA